MKNQLNINELAELASKDNSCGYPVTLTYTDIFVKNFAKLILEKVKEHCIKQLTLTNQDVRFLAGELTAQEMRSVQAVLKNRIAILGQIELTIDPKHNLDNEKESAKKIRMKDVSPKQSYAW